MQAELARAQALLTKKQPNPDKAIKMLRPLFKREQKSWMLYHYMGVAMLQKADYQKALEYLLRSIEAGGSEPESFHLLSVAYHNLGEFEKAVKYGNDAIRRKRDFLEAWINLGAAHRALADLDESMKAYSEANRLDPKNAGIAYRIGSIYFDQGDTKKARELYEITTKMEPDFIEAHLGQALIHLKLQEFPQAVDKIKEALNIDPNNRLARIQLAVAYKDWGKYTEAIKLNEQILRENPKDGRLRVNYALCLLEIGRFNEAEENYLRALKDSPETPESLSNYLMGIHYNPERTKEEIYEAHLLWDNHFAPKTRNERPIPQNTDPNKKLKIGFISGGFRKHPVGWMITRAIENLPKEQFEVFGYNTHSMYDSLTMRIRKRCDKWTSVLGYTDKIVAKIIKEDEIDILVELSGHSAFNRLKTVSLDPVPITIKWVGGLFNTTGLKTMDYLLTDHFESPVGEEDFYTEKLVRMPDDYVCYEPPEYDIKVGELPALYKGHITFGCFNNPSKLNDQLIEKWSQILHQVPNSKLFLKSKQYDTTEFVNQVSRLFENNGIGNDRIIFEGYAMHEDLLASYNEIDIALDPWPYSGGLTTCEALWMGVPVVTCAGPTFAGRHSVTHLTNSGNADWVTYSWVDYKAKVIELTSDVQNLQKIRATLRKKLLESPLCNGARFAAHLSMAFREMWKQRVQGYANNLSEGEWQEHIDVQPLANDELEEFYDTFNISREAAVLNGYKEFEINEELHLALPRSKENFTHYSLKEKRDSYQTLIRVLDEILEEGDAALEVGAGYGRLTFTLAQLVGKSGSIISLEPNPDIALHLQESRRLNRAYQVQILETAASNREQNSHLFIGSIEEQGILNNDHGTIPVITSTLDSLVSKVKSEHLKVLMIDTNGNWNEILNGADQFLNTIKPVLCIGNHVGFNENTLSHLVAKGYRIFEHIEEVGVLSELELDQQSSARWIFAMTDEWVINLNDKGFIFSDQKIQSESLPNYLIEVQKQDWAKNFRSIWIDQPEGVAEVNYFKALNVLWEVDQNGELTPAEKAHLSVEAASSLLDLYSANPGNISVACSLTRAFLNIGKQVDAVSILKNALEKIMIPQASVDLSLPFLLPLKAQENTTISSDPLNWLKVKIAEAWILLQNDSTYFIESKPLKFLKGINGNPDALPIIKTIAEELLVDGEIEKTEALLRKPAGKFIHICFNHVYAQSLSDLLVHANKKTEQEHQLLLEKHTAITNFFVDVSKNKQVVSFDFQHDLGRIKKMCLASDVDGVFFHGIFFDWQKKLVKHIGSKKHISWVMWGGDLYNPIKFGKPMRFLAGYINSIHSPIEGDITLFKNMYGNRDSYNYGYPYAGLYNEILSDLEKKDPPVIIVGNSGDKSNEHLEVLQILSEKTDIKNYRIVLPVAYNFDDDYESNLLDGIESLGLSDITELQKDFLSPNEYMKILTSAFMFIGAHERQQAIGNILGSLYGGNHTFIKRQITLNNLNRENPSWDFLNGYDFQIDDFENLRSIKLLGELPNISSDQRRKQQQVIEDEFGIEKRANQLIESCDQILEKIRSKQPVLEESV